MHWLLTYALTLSFPSCTHGISTTQVVTSTANTATSADLEEMVKFQEENGKFKIKLQILQSNHNKVNEEFKSLSRLHYQWKLACLWQLAIGNWRWSLTRLINSIKRRTCNVIGGSHHRIVQMITVYSIKWEYWTLPK